MQTHEGGWGGGGKKDAIYYDKTQYANFRDRPLFQATKKLLGQAPFSMFFGLHTYAKKKKKKKKNPQKTHKQTITCARERSSSTCQSSVHYVTIK